jgi:hypothetical protein
LQKVSKKQKEDRKADRNVHSEAKRILNRNAYWKARRKFTEGYSKVSEGSQETEKTLYRLHSKWEDRHEIKPEGRLPKKRLKL